MNSRKPSHDSLRLFRLFRTGSAPGDSVCFPMRWSTSFPGVFSSDKGQKASQSSRPQTRKIGIIFHRDMRVGKNTSQPASVEFWAKGPKLCALRGANPLSENSAGIFDSRFYPHRAVSMGMICFLRLMTPGRNRVLSLGSTENALRMASSLPTYSSCVPSSSTSVSISSTMS